MRNLSNHICTSCSIGQIIDGLPSAEEQCVRTPWIFYRATGIPIVREDTCGLSSSLVNLGRNSRGRMIIQRPVCLLGVMLVLPSGVSFHPCNFVPSLEHNPGTPRNLQVRPYDTGSFTQKTLYEATCAFTRRLRPGFLRRTLPGYVVGSLSMTPFPLSHRRLATWLSESRHG